MEFHVVGFKPEYKPEALASVASPAMIWFLFPSGGEAVGQRVANADGVELAFVRFNERGMIGTLKAVHGLHNVSDRVHGDMETLRALKINRAFKFPGGNRARYNGGSIVDDSGRIMTQARNVTCLGSQIYWR